MKRTSAPDASSHAKPTKKSRRDSPTKIRFFNAYDERGDQSLRSVCRQESEYPPESTARSWLRLRDKEGQAVAERRTNRAGNTRRGRPRKDVESEVHQMLDGGGDGKTRAYHAEKANCSEATLRRRIKEEKSKRRKERRVKRRSEQSSSTNQSG